MRTTLVLTLAGALLAAAGAPAKGPTGDKERLQGVWALGALEANGQQVPLKDIQKGKLIATARLVVKGDSYVFTLGENTLAMVFQVDPEKKPRAIDMHIIRGPNKGKTFHGIYELKGDSFVICRHAEPDKPRPTSFGTRKDSGLIMVTWHRINH